jgi:lipoate-protein ligase A
MYSDEGVWRFIYSGAADGVFNMACDEAAACYFNLPGPLLRIFTWQPYTISLGFHQKMTDLNLNKCKNDGVGVVRRPTGGKAVFHAEEVTYSVIIPKTHNLFSKGTLGVYNEISTALATGLNKLNLNLSLKKIQRAGDAFSGYNEEFACFTTSARYEIQHNSRKVVGSAQRRFENALLQHGSIITGDKHLFLFDYFSGYGDSESGLHRQLQAKTASVSWIAGEKLPDEKVMNAVRKGFEEHFGVLLKEDRFSRTELEIINQLKPKYSN